MLRTMAAKTKAPAAKRKRSKLTEAGDEGARLAKRIALLSTCRACGWVLTKVAVELELASAADVIRALKELAPDEYAEAQQSERVSRQNRTE